MRSLHARSIRLTPLTIYYLSAEQRQFRVSKTPLNKEDHTKTKSLHLDHK